jgi:hypothetical protein
VPERPLTPAEKEIADEMIAGIKHEIASAAAVSSAESLPQGSYAAIAQRYLNHQKPELRTQARQRATALLKAPLPERRRVFGRFAEVEPGVRESLILASNEQTVAKFSSAIKLQIAEKAPLTDLAKAEEKKRIKLNFGPTYTKLGFFVKRVKCLEETDEVGSDEILLGGFGVSPSGKMINVPAWKVSDDFDQGESVPYSPPRKFAEFNLAQPGELPWPRSYVISLVMGEEDSGGFGDVLQALWEKIAKEVEKAAAAAVGTAAGSLVGTVLGGAIGAVAGAVIGAIIGWLVSLFDNPDDYVGTRVYGLDLLSPFKSYYDSLPNVTNGTSAGDVVHFKGDGGRYDVTMQWRVYT